MCALRDATVMVTGGCGFIGSHLARRLVAEGVRKIIVIDSLRYGHRTNLGDDLALDSIEVVSFTLGTDPAAILERHIQGVDFLFHLAAEKHNQSKDDPEAVLRANISGSRTLFELAAKAGVKKTVFSSSLYAYGRMKGPPSRETDLPLPTTIYGISKLCGERLLAHYAESSEMKGDVLRYFFVYGPRQFPGTGYKSVIVKNFERIAAGQPPVIFGDGTQALDYVYVDDVVEATVRCMEATTSGEVHNVGSGTPTSINDLTDTMLAVSGSELAPAHGPADWTAGTSRVANVDKIRTCLLWAPQVSLHDGLRRTWNWVKESLCQ